MPSCCARSAHRGAGGRAGGGDLSGCADAPPARAAWPTEDGDLGGEPSDQFYAMGQVFLAFDGSYARAYDVKRASCSGSVRRTGRRGISATRVRSWRRFTKGQHSSMSTTRRAAWPFFGDDGAAHRAAGARGAGASVAVRYADDSIEIIDKTGKERGSDPGGKRRGGGLRHVFRQRPDVGADAGRHGHRAQEPAQHSSAGQAAHRGYSTSSQLYYKPLMHGQPGLHLRDADDRCALHERRDGLLGAGLRLDAARFLCGRGQMSLLLTLSEQGKDATALPG